MPGANPLQGRRTHEIVRSIKTMVRVAAVGALLALTFAAPAFADARSDARAQVEFGIEVAQRGLWREAIYRWERAVEIDPTYAAAYNNLAVGYEHDGQFDKAQQAYGKALELDPGNVQVRQNFELFKELNERRSSEKATQ
jgi:Flp pilus assembly protein TadD